MPIHMSTPRTFEQPHTGRRIIGVAHGDYATCSVCAPCTGWPDLDARLLIARDALLAREFSSVESFASAVSVFNLQRGVWISQECMRYLCDAHAVMVEELMAFVEHPQLGYSRHSVAVWDNAASDAAIFAARAAARGSPSYTHIPPLVTGFYCHITCDFKKRVACPPSLSDRRPPAGILGNRTAYKTGSPRQMGASSCTRATPTPSSALRTA